MAVNDPILPRIHRHPGAPVTAWTIYWICEPPGAPGKFVVRRQVIRGGEVIRDPLPAYVGDSLDDAYAVIPPEADTRLLRSPDDHATIVETWL
jgi:hypothetical protein